MNSGKVYGLEVFVQDQVCQIKEFFPFLFEEM
jgi:hypothetical protein